MASPGGRGSRMDENVWLMLVGILMAGERGTRKLCMLFYDTREYV